MSNDDPNRIKFRRHFDFAEPGEARRLVIELDPKGSPQVVIALQGASSDENFRSWAEQLHDEIVEAGFVADDHLKLDQAESPFDVPCITLFVEPITADELAETLKTAANCARGRRRILDRSKGDAQPQPFIAVEQQGFWLRFERLPVIKHLRAAWAAWRVRAFQINECDWVAAYKLEDALHSYEKETGIDEITGLSYGWPCEVSKATIIQRELDAPPEARGFEKITMRRAIFEHVRDGGSVPFLLASTEY